jgi:hypothetical protein
MSQSPRTFLIERPILAAEAMRDLANAPRGFLPDALPTDLLQRLEEAVAAYRAALEEWTRESGTARLEEAVAAYRAALEEQTRARVPLGWAMTQMNLGTALQNACAKGDGPHPPGPPSIPDSAKPSKPPKIGRFFPAP